LGSAGSVVPIFKEQIAQGGPITITHPEMRRYFMTIPEACQLVLQAGTMGKGGEIFVLDMGQPVKIVDLARDLIALSGLRPDDDIEIKYSGVRPGEKLFEELSTDAEHAEKTRHPKIFIGHTRVADAESVTTGIDDLRRAVHNGARADVLARLRAFVPEFKPEASAEGAPMAADQSTAHLEDKVESSATLLVDLVPLEQGRS
jgi:FlaA1/EpsC-like NDP-sugar epimerase